MLKFTNPITGVELQVANQDFSDEMTWKDAERVCIELGSGWRLPTKEELEAIYEQLHKKGQGEFKSAHYWSIAEYDSSEAWPFNFATGTAGYNETRMGSFYVRAVRAL